MFDISLISFFLYLLFVFSTLKIVILSFNPWNSEIFSICLNVCFLPVLPGTIWAFSLCRLYLVQGQILLLLNYCLFSMALLFSFWSSYYSPLGFLVHIPSSLGSFLSWLQSLCIFFSLDWKCFFHFNFHTIISGLSNDYLSFR